MMSTLMRHATTAAVLLMLTGCGSLDVSDPTAIEDEDVASATGSDLLRRDAVTQLYGAVHDATMATGLLSDELFARFDPLDRREAGITDPSLNGNLEYSRWQEVRYAATLAIPELLQYGAQASRGAHVGEMFGVRGYATVGLAEGFCAGFPLHDIADSKPVYGGPLTTDEAFDRAVADFDSAIVYAADSARVLSLVSIGRARALLGLGRFAEAGAAVGTVPTSYKWLAEFSSSAQSNFLGLLWGFDSFPGVGNREGGNGLDFVDANDPRLETRPTATWAWDLFEASFYKATKYPDANAPIVIASGIEARLIEAEAALRTNSSQPQWLAIVNTLRTSGQDADGNWVPGTGEVAGLAPLADPGTDAARVDLLFRERAFWLFGTGHRLGDLRRLIAHYGRTSESVFPTGPYYRPALGDYGPVTSLSFPVESEKPYSPSVTGCTDQ